MMRGKKREQNKQTNKTKMQLFFFVCVCVVMFVTELVSTQASSHWPSSSVIGVLAFHCWGIMWRSRGQCDLLGIYNNITTNLRLQHSVLVWLWWMKIWHGLTGSFTSGSYKAELKILARTVVSSKVPQEKGSSQTLAIFSSFRLWDRWCWLLVGCHVETTFAQLLPHSFHKTSCIFNANEGESYINVYII